MPVDDKVCQVGKRPMFGSCTGEFLLHHCAAAPLCLFSAARASHACLRDRRESLINAFVTWMFVIDVQEAIYLQSTTRGPSHRPLDHLSPEPAPATADSTFRSKASHPLPMYFTSFTKTGNRILRILLRRQSTQKLPKLRIVLGNVLGVNAQDDSMAV
jgi:hypothetical protein